MGWITWDYGCEACGHQFTAMLDRTEDASTQPCELCKNPAQKMLTGNICRVSYPDGTNSRWQYVKETTKLKRELRKVKRAGNKDDAQRIRNEIKTVGQVASRDKYSGDICKVSTPD